jgi:D-aminopeptidase
MKLRIATAAAIIALCGTCFGQSSPTPERPRARDIGLKVGILPTGPLNAITDVDGVEVGQTTVIEGDNIRTGVTAILPHPGNLFQEKVPGAVFVGNAFGKLAGSTQVNELGEIETPILLTSTLSVPGVANAVMDYMLALPGNEDVESINPLVGETNDGGLNDIRGRHISRDDVIAAIENAKGGPVAEGAVGAGTGTVAFGFKGGIGTSSRRLPASLGGYTVGVLVQTNYGGVLTIGGAPVGQELGQYYLKQDLDRLKSSESQGPDRETHTPAAMKLSDEGTVPSVYPNLLRDDVASGSCMIVIATDAPVDHRSLMRIAARAMMGLARTGSSGNNRSGDYAIAFSTAPELRVEPERIQIQYVPHDRKLLSNDAVSPLFLAVMEATEEAVYNSLFKATTTTGQGRTVEALPIDKTIAILRKHAVLQGSN